MIIIRSNYSPDAGKKQENDYSMAIRGALCMAGMVSSDINLYLSSQKIADRMGQLRSCKILEMYSITITNILHKSTKKDWFSHVETKIYTDGKSCLVIAVIERPILDAEAETYKDSICGYGEDVPIWPIVHRPGMRPLTKSENARVIAQVKKATGQYIDARPVSGENY